MFAEVKNPSRDPKKSRHLPSLPAEVPNSNTLPWAQCSPQGQDAGGEVVPKQKGGAEMLAGPHGHIRHPQSHCLIQGHFLGLGGVHRPQLHTAHREGLLPRGLLPTRATAPRALGAGLQRVGQLGPRDGALGEPV